MKIDYSKGDKIQFLFWRENLKQICDGHRPIPSTLFKFVFCLQQFTLAITFPFLFQVDPPTAPPASIVLVVGGSGVYSSEIIAENDSDKMTLPNLPQGVLTLQPTLFNYNNTILFCNDYSCLQLKLGSSTDTIWAHHSSLNQFRDESSGVSTNSAIFLFGGWHNDEDYEYLEFGTNVWKNGQTLIPTYYDNGCGVAASNEQILLIGGHALSSYLDQWIYSFNTLTNSFTKLSIELKTGRRNHACIKIPNTEKILVTGGRTDGYGAVQNSAEIIDMATQSVTYTGSMNSVRFGHGMGIMTIGNEDKIISFGGHNGDESLDTIEVYHHNTQSWELLENKLSQPKYMFGYLSIKNTGNI